MTLAVEVIENTLQPAPALRFELKTALQLTTLGLTEIGAF